MKPCLRDRDIKIEVECEDSSGQEYNENCKCGILKVGQLYFHAAELHSPTNGGAWWWWFETESLPIRRLEVLTNLLASDVTEDCLHSPRNDHCWFHRPG